mmetsp:Transcript_24738/g.33948  ORF Transcript_24738/g.33948 Transcript_24738/m.33948 type:complete len:217 (+) Transcript_24738:1200-1850(+)
MSEACRSRTASTKAAPSSCCTRCFRSSAESPGSTGQRLCSSRGPPSSCSDTQWMLQPLSLSPAASTARCTCRSMPPANLGSSDGCTLRQRPCQRPTNSAEAMRMKPTISTRSTPACSSRAVTTRSKASRLRPSADTHRCGRPCRAARCRMPACAWLDSTRLTSAASCPASMASMTACRAVPRVEPSTPSRMGRVSPLWAMSLRKCMPSKLTDSTPR